MYTTQKMVSLTQNKSNVVNFLIRNFSERNSIRMIAKQLGLSPMGAQKILKNLEKEHTVIKEKIGTGIFYKLDLNNDVTFKLAELILTQNNLNSYSRIYAKDLEQLREYAKTCVLYGSILTKGKNARDVDVLVIIDKKNFKKIEQKKEELAKIATKPIHFMYQTQTDFEKNIKKKDKPILDIIKKGSILWGQNSILNGIKNAS